MQKYNLWNYDDRKNIESLVLDQSQRKDVDNAKLLLDILPRSCIGHEFTPEKVKTMKKYIAEKKKEILTMNFVFQISHFFYLFINDQVKIRSRLNEGFPNYFHSLCTKIKMRELLFQKFLGGKIQDVSHIRKKTIPIIQQSCPSNA